MVSLGAASGDESHADARTYEELAVEIPVGEAKAAVEVEISYAAAQAVCVLDVE